MRVIFFGPRHMRNPWPIFGRIAKLADEARDGELLIVHGDYAGADLIADCCARLHGVPVEPHPADWKKHGKSAGPIRNKGMCDAGADLACGYWDGVTPGTRSMIRFVEKAGIELEMYREEGGPGGIRFHGYREHL